MEIQGWSNLPEEVQSWLEILHSQSPPLHVPQPAHLPRTCLIASHTDIHTHTHPHTHRVHIIPFLWAGNSSVQ